MILGVGRCEPLRSLQEPLVGCPTTRETNTGPHNTACAVLVRFLEAFSAAPGFRPYTR
jgi:hypothetical protein